MINEEDVLKKLIELYEHQEGIKIEYHLEVKKKTKVISK